MSHIVILSGVTATHWGEPFRVVSFYNDDDGVQLAECYRVDADAEDDEPVAVPVAELVFGG